MKTISNFLIFSFLSFFIITTPVYASDLIFDEDLVISINSVNYTIRAGSVASSMTSISDGTVDSTVKIADNTGGLGTLIDLGYFGYSVTSIGDLNGDGITDLAVGAKEDSTGGTGRGAVYILFMNADGTVASSQKIANNTGGFGTLVNNDRFGDSVASIGDLNGDGVIDLAVGADGDDTGGLARGAVYILFMNTDGTVSSTQKIADNTGGFGTLADINVFGISASSVGDLNDDGITDLAVGAYLDSTGGQYRGAIFILFMNSDGTVSSSQKIADNTGGFGTLVNGDRFGYSVTSIGDLNGDGITDLAVGALEDDTGGSNRGAVYILFMNTDGTVSSSQKIADSTGGFGTLVNEDHFGGSVSSIGDLDGDGIFDLAIGAYYDATGGPYRGAVYILFMNSDGTVSSTQKIADNTGGFGTLVDVDAFGQSVSSIGDFNGDGVTELAVGAIGDDTGGSLRGAVYILFLDRISSSHLSVTVSNGSSFTLVSSDKHQFSNDASLITNCLENESSLTINTDATVTITPLAEVCTATVSSGSSGSSRSSKKTTTVKETNSASDPTPPIANPSISYNLGTTTLKTGSSGLSVQDLQRFLNTQNFTLVVDGKFGPLTSSAVKQWQQAHGLVPDGLVGPLTRGKMGANN